MMKIRRKIVESGTMPSFGEPPEMQDTVMENITFPPSPRK